MQRLLLVVMLFLPIQAFADSAEDKTRQLFEVQNVLPTYQEFFEQSRAQVKEETRKMTDQMLGQLSPSKEFQDRFTLAADKFINTLITERTPEQLVDILARYYATRFTEQELDSLIAFYSSDLGKKDLAVSRDATQYLQQYYKEENERIRSTATSAFIKDLQLIALQCNCAKRPTAKKSK